MKTAKSLISLLLALCLTVSLSACGQDTPKETTPTAPVILDHAAQVKLDMSSDTAKVQVTVKTYIDGDTVHFHVPTDVMDTGVLKARFLAINTPESTGKIEEYGKKASRYTREKLEKATSIILESETSGWDPDSTGDRYLVWVWYKTDDSADYRNLNIEILQNGLAIANSSANNRYGDTCMAAISQAKAQKLYVYSGEPDPDYYYGEAIELTLKELRSNIESYNGMKVAFNGVITMNSSNSVYVEDYDPESGMYYGMSIYYGFGMSGTGLDILAVGNEARIVGTVQYYEAGGTWQVSDLSYRMMDPTDPNNIQKLSEGNAPAYVLTAPDTFVNGKVELEVADELRSFHYAQLALGTSVEMKGLTVTDVYTTDNADSSSHGAMTLTCQADGITVSVRTVVLYDEAGNMITGDLYLGKTIDVKGIVDYFDGTYQIKVFTPKSITIIE